MESGENDGWWEAAMADVGFVTGVSELQKENVSLEGWFPENTCPR
jgi:hypothetical protein